MKYSLIIRCFAFVVPFSFSNMLLGEGSKDKNSSVVAAPASTALTVSQGPKFAVIDMQRIILSVDDGKSAKAALEKEVKAKQEEFQKIHTELDKLNKEYNDQAPLLSEEARLRKQQEFQTKFNDSRVAEMNFQEQMKQKESQATQKIAMNVTGLVDGIAKVQNFDAVFELNSSGLVFLRNPVDLTEQVIKTYNETAKLDGKSLAGTKEASKATVNKKM